MTYVELQAFRPERDLALISRWLSLPHVARWRGEPETTLSELRRHREPNAIGRDVGPEALRQLFAKLRVSGVRDVGLVAAVANTRALRAYAKVGLRPFRDFIERGERYRYFTRSLKDAA